MTSSFPVASCIHCKEVKSIKGLFTHLLRKHGSDEEKSKFKSGLTQEEIFNIRLRLFNQRLDKIKKYYQTPNHCSLCKVELDWFSRSSIYCSHSCSATQNNSLRVRNDAQKTKTSETLKVHHAKKKLERIQFQERFIGPIYQKQVKQRIRTTPKRKPVYEVVGPFSKVRFCKCKFCAITFTEQTSKQICNSCKIRTNKLYVDYRFDFNVYDYPDLFDLVRLQEEGWFSPKGKSGRWNPNGLSRDHKVSVNESLRYNYDPFYITHPLNCELMPHKENNKKKTRSSITYNQLVTSVDMYEAGRASKNICSTN